MSEESYKILYFTAGQIVYYPEISYQYKPARIHRSSVFTAHNNKNPNDLSIYEHHSATTPILPLLPLSKKRQQANNPQQASNSKPQPPTIPGKKHVYRRRLYAGIDLVTPKVSRGLILLSYNIAGNPNFFLPFCYVCSDIYIRRRGGRDRDGDRDEVE